MNAKAQANVDAVFLPINAVERETGISKELLRMWERRYAFPTPKRDAQGDRIYSPAQVNKLRLLKRLIDQGYRPGKIVCESVEALENMLKTQSELNKDIPADFEANLMSALHSQDTQLRDYLSHYLIKLGLEQFVLQFMQRAITVVGDGWVRGEVAIHEEHLFTNLTKNILRQAIGNLLPPSSAPKVMLTTPPNEKHMLGTLMVESIMRIEGVDVLNFGTEMPISEIVKAVNKSQMDVVGLSFSSFFPTTAAINFLEELRFRLPANVEIWAGGASLSSTRRHVDGVMFIASLQNIPHHIKQWHAKHKDR